MKAHKLDHLVELVEPPRFSRNLMEMFDDWLDINLTGFYHLSMTNDESGSNKLYRFTFSEERDAILFKIFFQG